MSDAEYYNLVVHATLIGIVLVIGVILVGRTYR